MKIRHATSFDRAYRKLALQQREAIDEALLIFAVNPFDRRLRNHKLSGSQRGVRAISAGYDLRILYVEINMHAVALLIAVGTHERVY